MGIQVNGRKIRYSTFPGGEEHVDIGNIQLPLINQIIANLRSSKDIMQLVLTVSAIRGIRPDAVINLKIPYMPYARQDRICRVGEAFSLKAMADLINLLHCNTVTVLDPHSDVTEALLDRLVIVEQHQRILGTSFKYKLMDENFLLVAPDLGAAEKTMLISTYLGLEYIKCNKERTKEGFINYAEVPDFEPGRDMVIIDDICDGGRTFIELAKKLKEAGAGDLYLYVTHGIFSNGLELLNTYFKEIYCCHTWLRANDIREHNLNILGAFE